MPDPASTRAVRVYVNSAPVDVEPGATALDAVGAWDSAVAAQVSAGERAITDSRGIVTLPGGPVHGGAIYRVVHNRTGAGEVAPGAPSDPAADA